MSNIGTIVCRDITCFFLFFFSFLFFLINFVCMCSIWTEMTAVFTITGIALMIFLPSAKLMSAELKFVNQTHFRVNETSQTIVRLIVERVGDPVNVTALVLVRSC